MPVRTRRRSVEDDSVREVHLMSTVSIPPDDRLGTPIRDVMRPGVVTIAEHTSLLQAKRAMISHATHAVLVVAADSGHALGWVTAGGLLQWLDRDLSAIQAAHAITEPARTIEPDASARDALELLVSTGASHLLVTATAGGPPHGVVAPIDLVELVTRP
jgi:CBS domain-containing protein